MKAVIMQPTYLPWMGYFDLMDQSDVFVFLDDVQFSRRSWQQRNKIKTTAGSQWLTVPVMRNHGPEVREVDIREVGIDNTFDWASKHLKAIKFNYNRAKCFRDYSDEIETVYGSRWEKLFDLNVSLILRIAKLLGIKSTIIFSSQLAVAGSKTEKLVGLCKRVNADIYLSPVGSAEYINENDIFNDHGIQLKYHSFRFPQYQQLHGDFITHMSVLDLMLNEGKSSIEIIRNGRLR